MSEPSRTLSSTEEAALTGYDPDRTSYCSSCGRVTFYWERYEDAGTAVDRAVDALAEAATWGGTEAVRDCQNQEIDAADRDFVRLLEGDARVAGPPRAR